jgi:DNA-binding YbaB/EbfC family protein
MSKQLGDLMKQAQKMQERMGEIQNELSTRTCEASVGGGMVVATVNGSQELISLKIDPTVVDSDDVDMLQDLVVAAVNEGVKKSKEMMNEEMGKATGGFGSGMDLSSIFN